MSDAIRKPNSVPGETTLLWSADPFEAGDYSQLTKTTNFFFKVAGWRVSLTGLSFYTDPKQA